MGLFKLFMFEYFKYYRFSNSLFGYMLCWVKLNFFFIWFLLFQEKNHDTKLHIKQKLIKDKTSFLWSRYQKEGNKKKEIKRLKVV